MTRLLALSIALLVAPSALARTDGSVTTMRDGRIGTRMHAQQLANSISGQVTGRAVVGRCKRVSRAIVRCRFAAYGDEQVCRGWNNVKTSGDQYIMWFRELACH